MPDQSLSNDAVSGKTGQEASNPADTSANHPEEASPESQESNVTRASEGQQQQADQTINQDPTVATGDVQTAGTGASADEYDDENKWSYRDLQAEAKGRELDASGKREEIVARLRGSGDSGSGQQEQTPSGGVEEGAEVPRSSVDSDEVENGGIQRTGRGQQNAEILQGLSDERRQMQQAAVQDRSARSNS